MFFLPLLSGWSPEPVTSKLQKTQTFCCARCKSNLLTAVSGGSGASSVTPINRFIIKQASAEKAEKKDKGLNKEEFTKKVSAFATEVFMNNLKRQIDEQKQVAATTKKDNGSGDTATT